MDVSSWEFWATFLFGYALAALTWPVWAHIDRRRLDQIIEARKRKAA
jgi:predicted PurR-regulated permease PerM